MRKLGVNSTNQTPGSTKRGRPAKKKAEEDNDEEVEETPSKKSKKTKMTKGKQEVDGAGQVDVETEAGVKSES